MRARSENRHRKSSSHSASRMMVMGGTARVEAPAVPTSPSRSAPERQLDSPGPGGVQRVVETVLQARAVGSGHGPRSVAQAGVDTWSPSWYMPEDSEAWNALHERSRSPATPRSRESAVQQNENRQHGDRRTRRRVRDKTRIQRRKSELSPARRAAGTEVSKTTTPGAVARSR